MSKRRGRGEGSVEQIGQDRWRAWISAGKGTDGKRVRLSHVAATKREAVAWLRERQGEQAKGQLASAGKITVAGWLDEWLAAKKAKVEPASYTSHEQRARLHLRPTVLADKTAFAQIALTKLSPRHVEALHAALTLSGTSPSEQAKAATTLRACLAEAVKQGLLPRNVAQAVKKPKVERKEMRPLDAAEVRRLLAATTGARLGAWFPLAIDSGCRPGELWALHWPEVIWATGEVYVRQSLEELDGKHRLKATKTKAGRRRIRLSPSSMAALQAHREAMRAEEQDVESGPVFVVRNGALVRRRNFGGRIFVPALARAGLAGKGIKPYDLRHTSATLLLLAGVNIKVVSQRLGHESIEVTLRHYIHCLPSMEDAAVEAMQKLLG